MSELNYAKLCQYCFQVLETYLQGKDISQVPFPSEFKGKSYPLFVTWTTGKEKDLRGCIGTFKEEDFAIALKGQDVGTDTIQEPTVVADDDGTTCKLLQTFFQCAERVDVDVVGRFVEQKYVTLLLECHGQMESVTFTTRKHATEFALVRAIEVEA